MSVTNATAAAVLAFVARKPASGWDVARGLEGLIGRFWSITPSQIYRELRSMADKGLLEVGEPGPRDRRVYTLTSDGREALEEWLDEPPGADVIRSPLLLKLFLGESLPAERLGEYIASYRRDAEDKLERYRRALDQLDHTDRHEAHVIRYGVYHQEAVLRWLDSLPWS